MIALLLMSCTATIYATASVDNADVRITDYNPGGTSSPPASLAQGTGSVHASVQYHAFKNYYVWADAPGYRPNAMPIQNELKIGPTVAGIFCFWPAFLWAWGPQERAYITLTPDPVTTWWWEDTTVPAATAE